MLTVEQNDELTQVGPGTPHGRAAAPLLVPHRVHPRASTTSRRSGPAARARTSTLSTTPDGQYGIVPEPCPHRSASLAYGVVEDDGLRCGYHGWKFDFDGNCLEQPAEADNQNFRDRVRATAGQVAGDGRLVWAYVGPTRRRSCRASTSSCRTASATSGTRHCPATALQIMENSVDPHHVEWLHGLLLRVPRPARGLRRAAGRSRRSTSRSASRCSSGASSSAACSRAAPRTTTTGRSATRWCSRTYCGSAAAGIDQMQIRVPIDDTTTWHASTTGTTPEAARAASTRIPSLRGPGGSTRTADSSPTTSTARTSWPGSRRARVTDRTTGAPGPFGRSA